MSKLDLRRKNETPVPHDDSGTFFLVNRLSIQAGTETQRSRAATPYDRSAGRCLGASSASSPAETTGRVPASGAAAGGGPLSVGAGIAAGGASAPCACATEAPARTNSRAAQSMRVMGRLRLGSEARDYTHRG